MAKAYSDDLRNRVMMAYDCGEKQRSLAQRFLISEKTIYLWRKQRIQRGHYKPIIKYQRGHSHKISDLSAFKEFVIKNQSMTTKELAQAWGGISKSMVHRKLVLLKFTRKKKLWLPEPQRRRTPGIYQNSFKNPPKESCLIALL